MTTSPTLPSPRHDPVPARDPDPARDPGLSPPTPTANDPASIERASRDVVLAGTSGLHARPAAKVVEVARRYAASVTLAHGDVIASAKDLLDVLYLAAPSGATIRVNAEGFDAAPAVEALCALLSTLSDDA